MGTFVIKPNIPTNYSHLYDNAFLWKEDNVYVMACHRLALWCWLQQSGVLSGEYSLIHIDRHIDARRWEASGEKEILPEILKSFQKLKDLDFFESFKLPLSNRPLNDRNTRPAITWDNFVHLAAEGRLFHHYYIYASDGDWHTSLTPAQYSHYRQTRNIYNLSESIERCEGKCIVDIDLDFFDEMKDYTKKISDDGMLQFVLKTIAQHRDKISMITISTNDISGDELWEKRMAQMTIVKKYLALNIPIPIMK